MHQHSCGRAELFEPPHREGFAMTIVPRLCLTTVAAGIALVGGIASAHTAPQSGTRASANIQGQNQAASADRKICFRMEYPNTRILRRVCKTASDWQRDEGGLPIY
jgi:hypothetical protein